MRAEGILQEYFGYDTFRRGQKEAIDGILAGKDVLAVMPTGAGKSICFQVPALLFSGITLVISPLISLMQDQVASLKVSGIGAAYINSSLSDKQITSVYQHAKKGDYRLLYVAPERLFSPDFLSFAKSISIPLVVVDEAHCISQWGHDFRPSYSKIPEFIKTLPKRPVVSAFTATATKQVKEDIHALLQLESPVEVATGFDRENLYFMVQYSKDKFGDLMQFLVEHEEEVGIVYCSTRKGVEEVCQNLCENKISATRYHAGLSREERVTNQRDFLYDTKQVMVATNAFGMGIDKSNVSYVVHYNLPKDMESYYQEAGRAGRDGAPAKCLLLYNEGDVALCRRLISFGKGLQYENEEMKQMLQRRAFNRLGSMEAYAKGKHCLRHTILAYFGEASPEKCENCGECNGNYIFTDITVESQKVISCVARGREALTKEVVIDVLRGVESPEVLGLDLTQLTTFGISKQSVNKLSAIMDHLVWKEFLALSDEQNPKLLLTDKSVQVVKGMVYLDMLAPVYGTQKRKSTSILEISNKKEKVTEKEQKRLYEELRKVRLAYAKELDVPTFVIFSNATLMDMCKKYPTTEAELLEVSGVGSVKLEKYGSKFLEVFQKNIYLEKNQGDLEERVSKKGKKKEKGIIPTEEMLAELVPFSKPVSASEMNGYIKKTFAPYNCVKLSGRKITDWLVYMTVLEIDEKKEVRKKVPTKLGIQMGVSKEMKKSEKGQIYSVNVFAPSMQKWIYLHIPQIIAYAEENKKKK